MSAIIYSFCPNLGRRGVLFRAIFLIVFSLLDVNCSWATKPGVFIGNDPSDVARFEHWLGCPASQVLVFTDQQSWEGIANPGWFVERFRSIDRPVLWSFAMIPHGAKLQDAATGQRNNEYSLAARALLHARPWQDGHIYIRLGWEFNGNWFPWAAQGQEREFIAVFRHIVHSFRSVSDVFQFEWNFNFGQSMDPALAYPGDDVVDVIGMDFYWQPQYIGNDPSRAFAAIRDDRYGLQYLEGLARARGKRMAFSEWGIQGNDAAPFLRSLKEWISKYNIAYLNYWDSDADYLGKLSARRWPATGSVFRTVFCSNE
jgi:hypothetical protein